MLVVFEQIGTPKDDQNHQKYDLDTKIGPFLLDLAFNVVILGGDFSSGFKGV